jgi:hypothetical protein
MSKTSFFKELKEEDCVTLQQLHQIKGSGFTPTTVKKWIHDGKLTQGKHFIKLPGKTGRYRVSLPALNKYLEGIN